MTNQAAQTMPECTCRDNEGCTKPCDRKACQPVPLTEELLIEAAILSGDTPQERRLQKVLTQAAAALSQAAVVLADQTHFALSREAMQRFNDLLAAAPSASGVDTSTNEAWAARAQEKIEAMDSASGGEYPGCSGDPASCPEEP